MTFEEMMEINFDYKCITTFWDDFSIADHFGLDAIKDTYNRAFNEWKSDYKFLTELILVLNHKSWQWYERENMEYSKLYCDLYDKAKWYADDNLNDDEYEYYFRITN